MSSPEDEGVDEVLPWQHQGAVPQHQALAGPANASIEKQQHPEHTTPTVNLVRSSGARGGWHMH
jgi:hypothetical protein